MTLLQNPIPTRHQGFRRYVPLDQTSPLLSTRAAAIADFIIQRSNARRRDGLSDGAFYRRYGSIMELARRRYPLPVGTTPAFRTDSPAHFIGKR